MDRETIASLVAPVFSRHEEVVLAYLFGSAARGDAHEGSDLDLAVLLRDTSLRIYRTLWADLHESLGGLPFDLVTLNGADPVISFEVISEGKPIFRRSDEELNDFERKAWHRYQDTRHMRAIGDRYLVERAAEWFSRSNPSSSASSDSKR